MKMRSRLTALVLAVLMLISTAAPALAADALPLSVYQSMVDSAANQATSQPVIDEGGTLTDAATYIPQQKDLPIYESTTVQELSVLPAGSETAVTVALPQKGKVQLAVDAENGQWQAEMLGQWINLTGETGASCDVTYAKIKSLLDLNGEAKLRWLAADGESASQIAVITLVAAVAAVSAEGTDGEDVPVVAAAQPRMMMMGARSGVSTTNVKETYNYVINYVFEDNTVVADPYTANLAEGEAFTATVTFPKVVGYLPYVNNEQVNSYTFDVQSVSEDITITVVYKPTNVNYTVIHYQQNVGNDQYTEFEREDKQGLTNSDVPAVEKDYKDGNNENYDSDYAGFYSLLYEKPTIAADGTTVVEVYYDRYYYLINFDLDGGYGTEPIYARYGAPVEAETPTKAGYTFQGWSLDGTTAVALPETVPAQNVTYKALWKANDTAAVKVVFWGENPNDEKYSYLTTGVVNVKPGTKYTFQDGNTVFLICGKEAHTHTDDCILKCGKTEHTTHTAECFGCGSEACSLSCYSAGNYRLVETTKPDRIDTPTHNGIYSYTDNTIFGTITHYYLFLDGKWYCAEGSWPNGGDTQSITRTCSHDHTHTTACYTCEYHEHNAECFSCGLEEHTHTSSCNQTGSGLDDNLWTFVRSETVTVEADGSSVVNVYYDRTTFTMTFKKEGSNGATLGTITDKWGADIRVRFETISKNNTFFWSAKQNGGSPWTSFMDVMPDENRTYYADPQGGSTTITATYLGQKIGGTDYETLYTVSFRGSSGITVTKEEFVEIEGFTFNADMSSDVGDTYNGSKFYYDRHNYALEFYSPTTLLRKNEGIPFESTLSSYNWTPDDALAPIQYEPGSVTFEGWYLNPECTGEKYDFGKGIMPAGKEDGDTTLTLYAKWIPVGHKVEFYLDKVAFEAGTQLATHPELTIDHGAKVEPTPEKPTNGAYTFVGWFYIDKESGEEKAFDFANMPITKDMQVYGKWSSKVLKQYFVYFKLQGTETEIADSITGSALAGTTKTFEAKGGADLYDGYQVGYFPLVPSHSMTVDIADETKNVYTFWYVQKEAVPYTVYYVTETQNADGTLEEIELDGKIYYLVAETYTNSENRYAVVTEKFESVTGYMPDAYQKRLVVDGSDGAVNQIIFIYTVDTEHAYYKITHYTQNNDLETWTEYSSSEVKGDIGSYYTGTAQTIPGYTYDHIEYVVNGETVAETDITDKGALLTADGLEINLYYVLNEYPYQVRYLEQNTGKVLAEAKNHTGMYGEVISESAIKIDGYTAVDPTSQTLTIKIEEGTEVELNVVTFYYTENVVPINYMVAGVKDSGTVNLNDTDETTVPAANVTENVKVLTGKAIGATAAPSDTVYKFVGWYSDEACKNLISTEATYVPKQPSHVDETGATVLDKWQEATYYAKFEYNLTSLTIKKSGVDLDKDPGVSFVFNVEGADADLDVAINENGSVTIYGLTVGNTYTVSEVLGNWRYSANPSTKQITLAVSGNTVQFENKRNSDAWLDGDCYDENVFTAVSQ